ncbi:hypothetical protein M2125_000114 [Polynucleobacter sphagniphilus]|jgi:hypothetical protein|uniref:hypothetical protein n=1 Tax=Polynucleobacter sphagniphilus TaxID=1743169 RepID=UPI00247360B5|nr:hypothetical protein [Polynucleobacter sphagniphilus]MDH6240324.1 hypothetical protein [Polynucleobacter sphagniphilus]
MADTPLKLNLKACLLFATLLLATKYLVINLFGNATPFWDQWDGEASNLFLPWINGVLHFSDLVAPHNEHRILTMRLLSLGLLILNGGIWNPILEMFVNAVVHVFALFILIFCIGKSVPSKRIIYLLAFSFLIFSIPFGWENTLAGFQSQFYFLLLFSFGFLWIISTKEPHSKIWWLGVFLGILCPLSLASGALTLGVGVFIIMGRVFLLRDFQEKDKLALMTAALLLIITTAAIYATPTLAYHAQFKARNLHEFFHAFMLACSWPLKSVVFAALIQAPISLFFYLFVRFPGWRQKPYIFLIALQFWVFAQFATLAYGRYSLVLSSRYLDLFTIGLALNFGILLIFLDKSTGFFKLIARLSIVVWLLAIFFGIMGVKEKLFEELVAKKTTGANQEKNIRGYLCTGDETYLSNKSFLDIPYPDSVRLKMLLDISELRSILPNNVVYRENVMSPLGINKAQFCDYKLLIKPFSVLPAAQESFHQLAPSNVVIKSTWSGLDFFRSAIPGVKIYGSFISSDEDVGILEFGLTKGQKILYRSGPINSKQLILINDGKNKFSTEMPIANDWVVLSFSNPSLPERFSVLLIDGGTGWGEWSAAAFN